MRWRRRALLAVMRAVTVSRAGAVAVVVAGCGGTPVEAPAPGAMTLVYSGNVDGEIEPCG